MRFLALYLAAVLVLDTGFASVVAAENLEAMSRIKLDERVVFFPTAARLSDDGESWIVPIHGWIFEPEEGDWWRAPLVRKLREMVDLPETEKGPNVFEQRVRLFLVDNERGKRTGIRIAGREHLLLPSTPGGHFTDVLTLPADAVKQFATNGQIKFEAVTAQGDDRKFTGVAYCLPPTGITVISDIDDTIKVSEVSNKKELMRNTFLREFRAVDGMAAAYERGRKAGAQFHYVSASPWQLYEPLAVFLKASGFPEGTFHLKTFRAKDSTALDLFADPVDYKQKIIEPLLKDFPQRTFILVGDSAEKDPEIYGDLARKFPKQVARVFIRDPTREPATATRYKNAFEGVSADVWQVFTDPARLSWPAKPNQ